MAAKVVNLDGTPYQSVFDLIDAAAKLPDVKNVVMVLQRVDATFDVWYNRQTIQDVVMSSAVLERVSHRLVEGIIPDEK